jgi:hypothetical protein
MSIIYYGENNQNMNFLEGDQKIKKLEYYFYDLFSEFSNMNTEEKYFYVN